MMFSNRKYEGGAGRTLERYPAASTAMHVLAAALPYLQEEVMRELRLAGRAHGGRLCVDLVVAVAVCGSQQSQDHYLQRIIEEAGQCMVAFVGSTFSRSMGEEEGNTRHLVLCNVAKQISIFLRNCVDVDVGISGQRATALFLCELCRRFGESLLQRNSKSTNAYVEWLSAALQGIGHADEVTRRGCYQALRVMVPIAAVVRNDDVHVKNGETPISDEEHGRDRRLQVASNSLQCMLRGGPVPMLGTLQEDAEMLARLSLMTGLVPNSIFKGISHQHLSSNVTSEEGVNDALARDCLRAYQWEGVSWLTALRRCGLSGLLADDMGLGKTVQTLTTLAVMHLEAMELEGKNSYCLVLCPSSLMLHWETEINKFYPGQLMTTVRFSKDKDLTAVLSSVEPAPSEVR